VSAVSTTRLSEDAKPCHPEYKINMKNLRDWFRFQSSWWLAPLVLAAVLVWSRQIGAGGFSWSDAPMHALDGAFLLDLVREFPAGNVGAWSREYFARYPNLGLVVFYPPLFAGVEAIFFAILGVSAWAARVCVVFFAVGGLLAVYWIGRQWFDHTGGLFAAGLWAGLPTTVLWSRDVALEVPAAAMLAGCAGCYLRYKQQRTTVWLVLTAAALMLAALTGQFAIFFGAVILADLLRTLGIRKTFSTPHALAIAVTLLILGSYTVFSAQYAALNKFLVHEAGWQYLVSWNHWSYYLRAAPEVLGWPMLGLAAVGYLISASVGGAKKVRLAVLWIVIYYLFVTVIAYKEARYFYLVAPAAVLLAVGGLYQGLARTRLAFSGRLILTLVLVFQFIHGGRQDPGRPADYHAAAEWVLKRSDRPMVLVDATREGQFIFDLRQCQGSKNSLWVLRGSKVLYSRAAQKAWGYQEYVQNEADVLDRIRTYGVRYIVVESEPPNVPDWPDYFPRPSQWLRKVLRDRRRFEKEVEFPIRADATWQNVRLEVYRVRNPVGPPPRTLTLPVPSMDGGIEVPLPRR